jgi:hypothetical protein
MFREQSEFGLDYRLGVILKNLSEIIRKTKAEHKLDEIYKKPSRNQK